MSINSGERHVLSQISVEDSGLSKIKPQDNKSFSVQCQFSEVQFENKYADYNVFTVLK